MYLCQGEVILWKYRSQKSGYLLGDADWKDNKGTFQNGSNALYLCCLKE